MSNLFISCGGGPPSVPVGLEIIDCPRNYDQSGVDSLEVIFKISPINLPHYVWFKGACGRDTFVSSYSVYISNSSDSQTVVVKWRPESNQKIPTASYKVTGYMDVNDMASSPRYQTGELKLVNIYDVYDTILIAYSGCQRSARLDDRLNDTVAFKIRARLTNAIGGGINNKTIVFHTNKGIFVESGSHTHVTTTGYVHSISGFAEATLKLTQGSGGTGGEDYDYTITATFQSPNFTISRPFYERCITDNELSNIAGGYTHKRLNVNNPNTEIPGDNLPNSSTEDPQSNKKDVYIEVDYSLALPNIVNMVREFCRYAEKALERGRVPGSNIFDSSGIDVHFVVDEAISINKYASTEEIRSKLWESRDSLKYIHCLIGHYYQDPQGDTCAGGITLGWGFRNHNWPYAQRMFHAGALSSNEAIGNYRIDSMGCFVACERLISLCADTITGPVMAWDKVVGWAMAHEIGHALGLEHTPFADGSNLMTDTLEISSNWKFDDWGYFKLNRLHDSDSTLPYIYALDLLNKLGVETGSLQDHAFDRKE